MNQPQHADASKPSETPAFANQYIPLHQIHTPDPQSRAMPTQYFQCIVSLALMPLADFANAFQRPAFPYPMSSATACPVSFPQSHFFHPPSLPTFPLLRPIPHLSFSANNGTQMQAQTLREVKPEPEEPRTRGVAYQAAPPPEKSQSVDSHPPRENRLSISKSPDESGEDAKEELSAAAKDGEKPTSGGAYKRRNVYKSIVRHMFSYIRKNRDEIIRILLAAGYNMTEIEHAFFEVSCYNDMEQQKGNKKQSQSTIRKMVDQRTIYSYILRETLNAMIKNWDSGKHGKVATKNLATYRNVCISYYNEAVKVLTQEAQGTSYHL